MLRLFLAHHLRCLRVPALTNEAPPQFQVVSLEELVDLIVEETASDTSLAVEPVPDQRPRLVILRPCQEVAVVGDSVGSGVLDALPINRVPMLEPVNVKGTSTVCRFAFTATINSRVVSASDQPFQIL